VGEPSKYAAFSRALSALQGGEGVPNRQGREGEVGGAADQHVGPPHPTLSPRPAGEEGNNRAFFQSSP
jgi:hypothetical protein